MDKDHSVVPFPRRAAFGHGGVPAPAVSAAGPFAQLYVDSVAVAYSLPFLAAMPFLMAPPLWVALLLAGPRGATGRR
jgi:hypothetical protein